MMFLFFLSHWSYPRHPDVRFVWYYCKFYLILLINLRAFYFDFVRVLFLRPGLVIYCEQIIIFSVKLKKKKEPKGVLFYFVFCSLLFYTDWKYLVCMLPSIPICRRNDCFCRFSVVWRMWQPSHKPWRYLAEDECVVIVCCFTCSFFLLESCFVVTERCGMCNTAYCNLCRPRIVALYFLSTGFVSVQAETTCIFQMLYL